MCSGICFESNNTYLKLYQEIEDYLSNLLTIQTYNQFKEEDKNIEKYNVNFQESNKKIARCSLTGHLMGVVITIVFLFGTMYRSYQLLKNKTIDKATFMSLYFIISAMLGSLIYLSDVFQDLTIEYNNLLDIEKISKLNLFSEESIPKVSIEYPKIKTDSLIKVVDLEYKYPGSDTSIIKGLNLEIKKGERIALVGDIGAGKSTLLKIMLGLIKPTSGDLFLNGKNYKTIKQTDIFKKFGYMTQTPILFNRSILDNILFSNPDSTRKEVEDLLKQFGLDKVFGKLEKGIDTSVGKNGSKLSGGQKQVVWFLRIYLHNPDILLFDEPTASLSNKSKETLWSLIKKGFEGKTIIMASHDEFLIKMATRKIRIGK
jgi:ABC-type bacteriocin/lantibiotic exporter with double-glycine peptidase domain